MIVKEKRFTMLVLGPWHLSYDVTEILFSTIVTSILYSFPSTASLAPYSLGRNQCSRHIDIGLGHVMYIDQYNTCSNVIVLLSLALEFMPPALTLSQ